MNRVAIVGSGGSGKSYVAREFGCLLDAPVTHLDAVYYDDAWNPLPPEKFEAAQRELVALPRWVIDGNYNSSLHIRLQACGVYNRIHWGVITYVATYRRRMRPKCWPRSTRSPQASRWCS